MDYLVIIDNEGILLGYTTDEEAAKVYCAEENRKTYPYTHGTGVYYVPVSPMEFPSK